MQENREKFKDSEYTLVRLQDGTQLLESKDRYYMLSDIREALNENMTSLGKATPDDIRYVISEGLVDSEGVVLNEVRYDWNHIDPRTGMPKIKERPEDKIHLMNQMPGRSGWIVLLQNRVNLNSVGNVRYAKKVWYDRNDRTVSTSEDKEDAVWIKRFVLPGAGLAQGWIEPEIYTQYTGRRI